MSHSNLEYVVVPNCGPGGLGQPPSCEWPQYVTMASLLENPLYGGLDLHQLHAITAEYQAGTLGQPPAFDVSQLSPGTLASAFGAGFIFVGSLYLAAWGARSVFSLLRR